MASSDIMVSNRNTRFKTKELILTRWLGCNNIYLQYFCRFSSINSYLLLIPTFFFLSFLKDNIFIIFYHILYLLYFKEKNKGLYHYIVMNRMPPSRHTGRQGGGNWKSTSVNWTQTVSDVIWISIFDTVNKPLADLFKQISYLLLVINWQLFS